MKKIKAVLRKIILYIKILYFLFDDFRMILFHSLNAVNKSSKIEQAKILLYIHSLEKGLSFKNKKTGWGGDKAYTLTKLVEEYLRTHQANNIICNAVTVLNEYYNDPFSTNNEVIKKYIATFIDSNTKLIKSDCGGVKKINKPIEDYSYNQIFDFFSSRHSVREYSLQDITDQEFFNAKSIAKTTPSVCNRQACNIYSFSDKKIFKLILDNQLGDQGWCMNANKLYVITSSMSYYNGTYERHQVYIDGGLFAMNFVLGLHAQKIATCFKMYIREPLIDKKFKRICNIPKDEIPIVLVFAGHYLTEEILVPYSYRYK